MNAQIAAEVAVVGPTALPVPLKHWWESVPLPSPSPPTPSSETHRFYLCQPSKDRDDSMICQQGTRDAVEKQLFGAKTNESKMVTIKRGCPEFFDHIVLSTKLRKPVAMGMRLS